MSRPPHETAHREALLAHLTEVLGDQYVIAPENTDADHPVDLVVFAPSTQFPHPTLVTLGMSERDPGDDAPRIELLLGLPAGWPGIDPPQRELLEDGAHSWPLRLLEAIARVSRTDGSVLDWGHSVTQGGSPYDPSVPFTGALIGPPYGYPPQLLNTPTLQGTVQVLAVLPATPEELALQASVPSGGDMLLGRLERAGVTAVVDPTREGVSEGPAPWRLHALLREPAEHLGQVLDGVLPNLADQLTAQGIDELVLPLGPEPLRWRVGGRFAPTMLEEDLARSEERAGREQRAAPEETAHDEDRTGQEQSALRRAVAEHATVLTISPERPSDGATVTGAVAMAAMLIEAGKVAALWMPHQQHLTLPEQFLADLEAELPTTCRVHPETLADGRPAARTHGLAALGGLEVLFTASGLTRAELCDRVNRMLVACTDEIAAVPTAGQRAQLDGTTHELRPGADPDSGQEILELVATHGPDVTADHSR